MIYFKTVQLPVSNGETVENAVRRAAYKRNFSLDFQSSSTFTFDEKIFLGTEDEHELKIMRMRTPFERFFPKLILCFNKKEGFSSYKMRLGFSSSVIFLTLTLALFSDIFFSISEGQVESDFAVVALFWVLFVFSIIVEIALTKRGLKKALESEGFSA